LEERQALRVSLRKREKFEREHRLEPELLAVLETLPLETHQVVDRLVDD
jgi:hypothetical protein